jgi:pre-rRNA-processing protein TSR3
VNSSTIILRHPRERLSKCSLEPVRGWPGIQFYTANRGFQLDTTNCIVLGLGAKELSMEDSGKPLILLDSTWRLLRDLQKCLTGTPIYRTLPFGITTAYPRVSKISEDPLGGLASVEALYLAWKLLGVDDSSLLDHYHWKSEFLKNVKNWEDGQ